MDRATAGRIGGLTTAALAPDTRTITEAARKSRWQRYLDQVPAAITDQAERERRAALLRRADMIRMSLRSAQVRKARSAARKDGEP